MNVKNNRLDIFACFGKQDFRPFCGHWYSSYSSTKGAIFNLKPFFPKSANFEAPLYFDYDYDLISISIFVVKTEYSENYLKISKSIFLCVVKKVLYYDTVI